MSDADRHLLLVLAEMTRAHLIETVEHAHAEVARLDAAVRAVRDEEFNHRAEATRRRMGL